MVDIDEARARLLHFVSNDYAQALERLSHWCAERTLQRPLSALFFEANIICRACVDTGAAPGAAKPASAQAMARAAAACGFAESACESAKIVRALSSHHDALDNADEDIASTACRLGSCATDLGNACVRLASGALSLEDIAGCLRKLEWAQREINDLFGAVNDGFADDEPPELHSEQAA